MPNFSSLAGLEMAENLGGRGVALGGVAFGGMRWGGFQVATMSNLNASCLE